MIDEDSGYNGIEVNFNDESDIAAITDLKTDGNFAEYKEPYEGNTNQINVDFSIDQKLKQEDMGIESRLNAMLSENDYNEMYDKINDFRLPPDSDEEDMDVF